MFSFAFVQHFTSLVLESSVMVEHEYKFMWAKCSGKDHSGFLQPFCQNDKFPVLFPHKYEHIHHIPEAAGAPEENNTILQIQ